VVGPVLVGVLAPVVRAREDLVMGTRRRRHTPEQIVRKLREADRLLGEGRTVPEVAKVLEVSEQTFHRWRAQYGGMKADDVKRLKELERENQQLKRIVADQLLENQALKEIARGNW
jgi:transposase-like protein